MADRILTLDNLYEFYVQQNKNVNFSSKDSKQSIIVRTPGNFSTEENDIPGMLRLKFKVCHTLTNRNGSHISEENMTTAMPSLKYRPVLAYIHELEDGTKDFYAHNMEIVENTDGESEIHYLESPVGCFTAEDPWLEYDEESDKTYVMAYALIPEDYTETADIIRRKNGTKVSCELVINELSYNAKEKYLDITDFYFNGVTLLGKDEEGNDIGEGMLGARADIDDFCHKEPVFNYQDKLVDVLNKLDITLSNFNNNSIQKGGDAKMSKFEELLEKYGKTIEDIEFEYEEMEDEELEAKFAELFDGEGGEAGGDAGDAGESSDAGDADAGEAESEAEPVAEAEAESSESEDEPAAQSDEEDESAESDGEDDDDDADEVEVDDASKKRKKIEYELSHDDIRCALYDLLNASSEESYWYWIAEVYDNSFIYENYSDNARYYRQKYSREGDNIAFDGEPVEVFSEWLTQEEIDALSALKADYEELKSFKEKYDADEVKAAKDAIFESAEYAEIKETEEFKALIADADKYSVDDLRVKADLVFAAAMKEKMNFEVAEPKKNRSVSVNLNEKQDKKKPYGRLFK